MRARKLFFFILAFLFLWPLNQALAADELEQGAARVKEIMECLYQYHVFRPSAERLVEGAIEGLLEKLGDPYTEYLSEKKVQGFTESLEGEYEGIGVELEAAYPYPRVGKVFPNSPASQVGIKEGDVIVRVEGEDIAGMPLAEVVNKIRGPVGSQVVLTIRREGGFEFSVRVVREAIKTPSLEWEIFPDNVVYVKIFFFGSHTATEFSSLVSRLKEKQVKGIILDLRDNPGGYLQAAVDVAGFFLPSGQLVVTTTDRDGKREEYYPQSGPMLQKVPVVVLVNGNSASAAEVLAGALEDYGRAVLVGSRSYGKGVVQAVVPLKAGGALKFTIARFLTPRGRFLDGNGLVPRRQVSLPCLAVAAARQELLPDQPRTVLFNLQGGEAMVGAEKIAGCNFTPVLLNGEWYLPLRFTLEALGYSVNWKQEEGRVVATDGKRELVLAPLERLAFIEGQEVPVDPYLVGENLYLPSSIFARLGIEVKLEGEQLELKFWPS